MAKSQIRTLSTSDRLKVAAARGMGDAVRSHLISMDYALSKADMESTVTHWTAARQDFEVLMEALKQMEVA